MTVSRPKTGAEAVSAVGRDPQALILAGGTDLMVLWNMGALNRRSVVDLSAVREWRAIAPIPEGISIGAMATHAEIRDHKLVRAHYPLLARACAVVGAAQIQNRGTLGGNLANASPAGDTFPPLAVYEALVHVASTRGRRIVAFSELFTGVKKTSLRPGELISAVELHEPGRSPDREFFRKVGTRAAQAISKIVGAGLLWLNKDKTVAEVRVAFGSMAPTVRRLKTLEEFITKKPLSTDIVDEACRLVERDLSPIDDLRSTRAYRLEVARNLVRRFLENKA
jgi:xanthine dehydrogenase small subunit